MDLISNHKTLLEQWRKRMNLVGPGPIGEHYADAEACLAVVPEPTGEWADLGSGAGFPGIVFAARYPEVSLDFVDSRRKRCVFVDQILMTTDLADHAPRRVLCQRVESLPDASYDGIISRAFAPPEVVLDHADRLLRPGGELVLLLQDRAPTPEDPRFTEVASHTYTLPGREPRRSVRLVRAPAQ